VTSCHLKNNFTEQHRAKAQPTWFGTAVDRVVMKYMCPNVFNDTLLMQRAEIDDRLALRTSQPDMFHARLIHIKFLYDKACSPW
jgi:hypothetical protein